ncbi:TonB system transport protein ExbD [Phaeovulum sp.]|uniref:TonB system transport protein ExbD n=1 Tax=Phaeovulum sp. TaxID=2934796 RepID=UPI003565A40F
MGFSVQTDDASEEMSEINVTPFIDVMLVLLIIFMIAAPLSTVDIPVDLPGHSASPPVERPDEPIYLTLTAADALTVGTEEVSLDRLGAALDLATKGDKAARLFLRADETVPYGKLIALMDQLKVAGYLKIALVARESGGGSS